MKKSFLFGLLGLSMVLASCQKQEGPALTPSGTLTVTIPQESVQTRAAADYGQGSHINRCILEVYRDDVKYKRYVTTVSNGTATFDNLQLVASQAYDFVFWADCGTESQEDKHYNTTNLTNITVKDGYAGNNDEFDAFFHAEEMTVTDAFSKSVTLTRPFGQLNVKTNDMGVIGQEELKPTHVTVDFVEIPTSFNALTGEAGDPAAVSYNAAIVDQSAGELTVDYIWAAPVQANLADFSMTFLNGATEITTNDNFHNIPIRRNYKTSVSGNLLTKTGTLSVKIDPTFSDQGYDESITEVEDIAAANAALAAGKTNVVVAKAPESEATILIPKIYDADNDTRISISLPATNQTVNFVYGSGSQYAPATVNVSIPTTTNVVIDLQNSTVTLNGQTYQSVTASTADNTLIIDDETTVENLTVKKGNVEVYGTLKNLVSKPGTAKVTLHVTTADDLQAFAARLNEGGTKIYDNVVLEADIDFKGSAFSVTRVNNVVLDGQGHKISNYKVEKNTQSAGLFCDAVTVTVRNLTLENANVKAVNDGNGNAYAGALMGRTYGTIVVDNVHVMNPTIEGVNKVGGLIGFIAENSITATNCSVEGATVTTSYVEGESGQIGGFIGYLGSLYAQTCSFSNCYVENTVINAYMTREDRTISKFIGCFQGNQATDVVNIDNCRVDNVTLNALDDMAASYFSPYGDLLGGQRFGKGTVNITNSETAIILSTPAQLKSLAAAVNSGTNYAKVTFKLDRDIDLANESWTPIGKSGKTFNGIFDGNGHTISNLTIDKPSTSDVGFFGFTQQGEIKNLNFHNATVKGYLDVGVVAGTPYTSKYSNITLTGTVVVDGYAYVGGMFGKNVYANLTNLTVDVDENSYVHAESENYRTYVGGVIGFMGEGNITVSNVVSNIDVAGSTCDVGGVSGNIHCDNSFVNCSSSGNVTLTNAQDTGDQLEIGGIAGTWVNTQSQVRFSGCSFTGTLKTYLNGEDRTSDLTETHKTVGRQWSTSGSGQLIIE